MSDLKLVEAKMLYLNTGRLNQNIVNKEIAISWYKCKLQNMKTSDSIKLSKHEVNNHFTLTFMNYIDSIVSDIYQYALANVNLQVCKSRIEDSKIAHMNSIDDLLIGTNGGYNATKNQKVQVVSKNEHFLDDLVKYYTIGIPIIIGDKNKGTLMIISEQMPSEYEISGIKEKLIRYYNKEAFTVTKEYSAKTDAMILFHDFLLNYPNDYKNDFQNMVDTKLSTILPILITGSAGCGKTTLAWYLSLKRSHPYYIDMSTLHPMLQHSVLENALCQNETVIVDNIEQSSKQSLLLLTVYTDKKIDSVTKAEQSKFKCLNLFLITANKIDGHPKGDEHSKVLETLKDKLKISTIHMRNLNDFPDHYEELHSMMCEKYSISNSCGHSLKQKRFESFKELYVSLHEHVSQEKAEINFKTLEEQEKAYILSIYEKMNHNITLTSEILGIGRSTLYRKLEKYQNETSLGINLKKEIVQNETGHE